MIPFFLFPCGNCCTDPCTIGTDTFDRADSTSLGSDWSESAGDWEISSNKLQTDDANAILLHQSSVPSGKGLITVTVNSSTVGAQAVIIGAYTDASNYIFVRWTFNSLNGQLALFNRVGGVNTQLGSTVTYTGRGAGTATTIRFCWTGVKTHALALSVLSNGARGLSSQTGDAGLGTATTGGNVTFDNFTLESVSVVNEDCPLCEACFCCNDDLAPSEVHVTFSGITGTGLCPECTDLNATFVCVQTNTCQWTYTGFSPFDCHGMRIVQVAMSCTSTGAVSWFIYLDSSTTNPVRCVSGGLCYEEVIAFGDTDDRDCLQPQSGTMTRIAGVEPGSCTINGCAVTITPVL